MNPSDTGGTILTDYNQVFVGSRDLSIGGPKILIKYELNLPAKTLPVLNVRVHLNISNISHIYQ